LLINFNMTAGDPRLHSPEFVTPDRILFLDGTVQSITSAEHIYHEALVHPAMFAHPAPKRVAILGGGEGATLREVLKHNTIETALMIEIDQQLVAICREFLPSFSDCSDLKGRANNCFDDKRADVQFADGRQWFIDRFGTEDAAAATTNTNSNSNQDLLLDVIILDALDPEDETEISDMLYSDKSFINSLVRSLSDQGVLVIQIGTAATIDDPRSEFGIYKNRELLFHALEENPAIATMLVYEEPHCGFLEPHAFLVACRSDSCRSRWYARSDQVDYQIYDRIVRTHSKERALVYFDGTTQRSYQWPKKGWETVYCRREPVPFECAYRTLGNAEIHDFELDGGDDDEPSSFRVEKKGDATHVYATTHIPKGSFIMPEHLASSLQVTQRNLEGLHNNVNVGGGRVAIIEDLLEFFAEYGHESAAPGSAQHYIEVGGSVLIRRAEDDTDEQVNVRKWLPEHPSGKRPTYSPVYERHRVSFDVFMVASKDIAPGEEVVMPKNMW